MERPEKPLTPAQQIIKDLAGIQSIEDLNKTLGLITPEEQVLLSDPALHAPSTPEELAALGPDFTDRLVEKTGQRFSRQPSELEGSAWAGWDKIEVTDEDMENTRKLLEENSSQDPNNS